jgi:hypothetical protein
MLRSTRLSLVIAGALALAAIPARAQDAAAPAPAPAAASTAAPSSAGTASATVAPSATDAAVMPGAAEKKADKFPLHINASLSNAFGNGILQAGGQYQQRPVWSTGVGLNPSASLPTFGLVKALNLGGSINFSVGNWLPSYNSDVYDRIVRVSDPGLSLSAPGIFKEEAFTNISLSVSLSASAPLSLASRVANKLTTIGFGVNVGWSSPETPVGTFNVSYGPRVSANVFSQVASTIPCDASISIANDPTRPIGGDIMDDAPVYYARDAQRLPNGECIMPGRQSLGSLANTLGAGWNMGSHSVGLNLAWRHSLLRPLSNHPELTGRYASGQNFNESNSAGIDYSYQLPLDFDASISAGLSSGQGAYDMSGDLRFPFWDFVTPGNNFSAASVSLSVGI